MDDRRIDRRLARTRPSCESPASDPMGRGLSSPSYVERCVVKIAASRLGCVQRRTIESIEAVSALEILTSKSPNRGKSYAFCPSHAHRPIPAPSPRPQGVMHLVGGIRLLPGDPPPRNGIPLILLLTTLDETSALTFSRSRPRSLPPYFPFSNFSAYHGFRGDHQASRQRSAMLRATDHLLVRPQQRGRHAGGRPLNEAHSGAQDPLHPLLPEAVRADRGRPGAVPGVPGPADRGHARTLPAGDPTGLPHEGHLHLSQDRLETPPGRPVSLRRR